MQNPAQFKIPTWFLNRRKDMTDGKNMHAVSNIVDQKIRDDLERLKKIRSHRWVELQGRHLDTGKGACVLTTCFFRQQRSPSLLGSPSQGSTHLYHWSKVSRHIRSLPTLSSAVLIQMTSFFPPPGPERPLPPRKSRCLLEWEWIGVEIWVIASDEGGSDGLDWESNARMVLSLVGGLYALCGEDDMRYWTNCSMRDHLWMKHSGWMKKWGGSFMLEAREERVLLHDRMGVHR